MSTIDNKLISVLKEKWNKCESETSEVFRYKLNISDEKILKGEFKFYVQVNINIELFSLFYE